MTTRDIVAADRRVQYSGSSGLGPYSFAFQLNATSELAVYIDSTLKTETTHYTVTLAAAGSGSITFASGQGPTALQTVTLVSNVPITRTSVYSVAGSLTAASLENDFDTNRIIAQQINEKAERSLHAPEHDPDDINMELPAKADRLSKVLQFDSNGEPIAVASLTDSATTSTPGLMSTADKAKLDGIATGADVTTASRVNAVGAVMNTDTSTAPMQFVVDEDNMASNSATKLPTQQSVKAYVDSQVESKDALSELSGDLDDISDGFSHVKMTNAERTKLTSVETGATADQTDAQIKTAYENNANTNAFTNAEQTKLSGIEANATADQTDAEIKTAYENNSDTNAFTDAEKTKLTGIETGATGDQTASEILTAIKTVDGTASGLDADLLDGQEGSYYQPASTALTTSTNFTGDVSGTYNAIVIADDSHNHIISNVDGLQTALDAKAPLASPALTGTPTAPTAAADTSTTQIATTAFVQQELAELIDTAPSTLDTLNEIAAAINDDPNFNTTVTNSLANRVRVDTSSQGLTSTQQSNARTNIGLATVASTGAYSDLSGTPTIPSSTSDLTNDSGFITSTLSGNLDLNGNQLILDADGDTGIKQGNDDVIQFFLSNIIEMELSGTILRPGTNQGLKLGSSFHKWLSIDATDGNFADTTVSNQMTSTVTTGTAPLVIASTTKVANLNVDKLDDQEGSYYLNYNNFTNTPTIPTNNNELSNGAGYITSADGGNATTLDSLDSTQFLRSDTSATFTSGTLKLNDDTFLAIGTGADFSINHNGSRTSIAETGTGDLFIDSSTSIHLRGRSTFETLAKFTENGAAELYYDSAKKAETTSTGIEVTGTVQAGIFKTDATPSASSIFNTSTNLYPLLISRGDDETQVLQIGVDDAQVIFNSLQDEQYGGFLFTSEADGVGTRNRLVIDNGDGDISFYNNTGANRNFYWDATNSRLGINNTSPSTALDVNGDLTLTSTDAGATENPTLDLYRNSASPADNDTLGHIKFNGENSAGEKIAYAEIQTSISDVTDGNEGARLQFGARSNGSFITYLEMKFGQVRFNNNALFESNANIIFEGATNDGNETQLTVIDPTQDNIITLPDKSGTVAMTSDATSKAIAFSLVFG